MAEEAAGAADAGAEESGAEGAAAEEEGRADKVFFEFCFVA